MTAISIVCDNCGAKYKLPETFSGAQAKCQKCGSAIDVARQRGAADVAPAAARPAGARPAVDRSKEAPRAERAPAITAPRPAREDRSRAADGGSRRRDRTSARDAKPAKSKLPWIVAAVVVVGAVIAFVATR